MTLKKRSLIFAALVVALVLAMAPGVAMAYNSVHGGYAMDTDSCAGCHRAHTASSPLTWTDSAGRTRSALLLSTATTSDEFCYTCHGSAALGADTNVWDGVFQARDGMLGGDRVYNANGAPLNGGGFNPVMFPTQHYPNGSTWVAWGAGPDGRDGIISLGGEQVTISCTACHDTHGSSNYRLLKDRVAGIHPTTGLRAPITVGGYSVTSTPTPFVISTEEGYPVGGWAKGEARKTQYTTYKPDFTRPRYAKAPGGDVTKGISGWCAACHTQMQTAGETGAYVSSIYDHADGFGLVRRHRHPVNVPLNLFRGSAPLILASPTTGARLLPLGNDTFADSLTNEMTDWVDCLTCHVAHGSRAAMSGFASVADATNPQPNTGTKVVAIDGSVIVTVGSVPPDYGNALLRLNNRGVCQSCHYK